MVVITLTINSIFSAVFSHKLRERLMLNIYVGIEEMQKINFIIHLYDIYFLLYMTDDLIAHLVL
jgi:hypothetical protein